MDKKQIVRVIIKKTQLACAFTEKADMCYYGKNTACVIMEKKKADTLSYHGKNTVKMC